MAILTPEQFYTRSINYTSDLLPVGLVQEVINIVCERLNLKLRRIGVIFSTINVTEEDRSNYTTIDTLGKNYIPVGAWQEDGLQVKRTGLNYKYDSVLTPEPLVIGQDYTFVKFYEPNIPGLNNPVTHINLKKPLADSQFIRLYGTFGFGTTAPEDIVSLVFNEVKMYIEYNYASSLNLGNGQVMSEKSLNESVKYGESDGFKYGGNMFSHPFSRKVINNYFIKFKQGAIL